MKRNVAVGSTNPVKLEAVKAGFRSIFPGDALEFVSLEAASGVSAQPMGDAETRQGAENRALAARNAQPDADFWVGVEGGAEETPGSPRALLTFAWVVILARGRRGQARTAAFELPEAVADLVRPADQRLDLVVDLHLAEVVGQHEPPGSAGHDLHAAGPLGEAMSLRQRTPGDTDSSGLDTAADSLHGLSGHIDAGQEQ